MSQGAWSDRRPSWPTTAGTCGIRRPPSSRRQQGISMGLITYSTWTRLVAPRVGDIRRTSHHRVRRLRTPCLRRARRRPARVSHIAFLAIMSMRTVACYLNHGLHDATTPPDDVVTGGRPTVTDVMHTARTRWHGFSSAVRPRIRNGPGDWRKPRYER
jgi:hypothetical protein